MTNKFSCQVSPLYQVRFIAKGDAGDLINLYYLARTALSDKPLNQQTPYFRMVWASGQFAKTRDVTSTGAYKDLCGLLDR